MLSITNRIRAVAATVQAGIAFLLITQTDVALDPAVKVVLGLISVALAATDWGALVEGKPSP